MRALAAVLLSALIVSSAAAQFVYVDPTGSYQFQLPEGWSLMEQPGYVFVSAPNDEIIVVMSVEDTTDFEEALQRLWDKLETENQPGEPIQVLDVPQNQLQGFASGKAYTYADGSGPEGILIVGGVYELDGRTYPSIVFTTLASLQRRFSQYLIISQTYRATSTVSEPEEAASAQRWNAEMAAELRSFVTEALSALNVPGAAVAVVQNGRVVFAEGFGTTGERPVDADTIFLTASISKSMTTLAMAQAVDDGLFTWETPAVEVLPTFAVADPDVTRTISMEKLVCACSGVPRRDFELLLNTLTAEDVIESLKTFEFFTAFGETFQYSNQLVAAAGYLTALARGGQMGALNNAFADLLEEYLFVPLTMERTTLRIQELNELGNVAQPFGRSLEGLRPFELEGELWVNSIAPSGGVWSTANDMARYLLLMLNEGELEGVRLVGRENLTRTWQPQVRISARADYGLGWILTEYAGNRVIGHDGNALGYTSAISFLPAQRFGVVVLANAGYTPLPNLVMQRVWELLLGQPNESITALAEAADQISVSPLGDQRFNTELNLDLFRPFLGEWRNDALGDLAIRVEGETVVADFGEYETRLWELLPQTASSASEPLYVSVDAPIAGQVLLRFRESQPLQIVFGSGVTEYVFTRR